MVSKAQEIGQTVITVLVEVGLPLAVYYGLRSADWSPIGALTASVVASTAVVIGEILIRRRVGVLTHIILVGTGISLLGAVVSGNQIVLYMRDPATDVVIAVIAARSLHQGRPFVASIRRDLSASPSAFDDRWRAEKPFRQAHSVASWWWVGGLLTLAALSVGLVLLVPFDAAVGVSQVLGAVVIGGLIVLGEVIVRGARSVA